MTGATLGRAKPAILRWLVGDLRFTIVSNNCWGAHIYQALGIAYRTPFVGLFIPPKSYVELLRQFDYYVHCSLEFVDRSTERHINAWRENEGLRYPIGLLGGAVEINFQHYADEHEAREKWTRRCECLVRDPNRRYYKFDDREGTTDEGIRAFCALPLANRVCFTSRFHDADTVVVPPAADESCVPDGVTLAACFRRYFNTMRWISRWPRAVPQPSLL